MHSIKTAVVVSILLVVGYAVYTTLNNERAGVSGPSGDDWPGPAKADAARHPPQAAANPFRQSDRGATPRGFAEPASPGGPPSPAGVGIGTASRPAESAGIGAPPDVSLGPAPRPAIAGPAGAPAAPTIDRAPANAVPSQAAGTAIAQDGIEFRLVMDAAWRDIKKGSLKSVLAQLTPLYGEPSFSPEESQQLTTLLGQLAGEVIYSRKHYLHDPYVVQQGDTLPKIAQHYCLPWQLLGKINGVMDPERLTPGSKLKVIQGPFDAMVLLDRYELVLYVENLYAGRFPIGVGRDQPRLEGDYVVRKKLTQPADYHADNSFGKYWIALDERIGIHGTSDVRNLRRNDGRGSICLGDRDLEDVFEILSAQTPSSPGSKIAIRRSIEPLATLAQHAAVERR